MPRRSVSAGNHVFGPVPKYMHGRQEPSAIAGYSVLTAGFEDARTKRAVLARGAARILHC